MRFVTLITPDFLPGTIALVNSLNKNAGIDYELLVLTEGCDPEEVENVLGPKAKIQIVRLSSIGDFKPPKREKEIMPRLVLALQKLMVFKLEDQGPMCFLDSDIICIGNLKGIEQLKHFSASILFGITLAPPVLGRPQFCTGSFVFQPSQDFFDELQDFALAYEGPTRLADQDMLNAFMWERHPDDVRLLSTDWEISKRAWLMHRQVWNQSKQKRFLHFVGDKPWQPNPDPQYADLNKLWWEYRGDGKMQKNIAQIAGLNNKKPIAAFVSTPRTKLSEYLKDKTVAIIAPSAHVKGSAQREHIESHDVVVRLNRGFIVPEELIADIGERTDVIYHIMTKTARSLTTDKVMLQYAIERSKFIVSVHPRGDSFVKDFEKRINGKIGFEAVTLSFRQFVQTRIKSMPNCGTLAIAHLLTQPIKSLYLTGFSFYETGYYTGYRPDWTPEQHKRYRGVSGHHQPSQKTFVKWLLENTKIPVTMDKTMGLIFDNVLGWEEQAILLEKKNAGLVELRALIIMRHNQQMILDGETFLTTKELAREYLDKRMAMLV